MINFTFELNDKPLSALIGLNQEFPAFSGKPGYINKPSFGCYPNFGPIPIGRYYIVDRQSGGILGSFKDMRSRFEENDRTDWFSLFAIDDHIDDYTYCDEGAVERSYFRLHPGGESAGCITLTSKKDFLLLRTMLKNTNQKKIENTDLLTYGVITVK